MLTLLFYLGDDCYALAHDQIVEVIPTVDLREVPRAPDYVAGLFNYRGLIVPVIDLCQLAQGHPCRIYLSTRIILVNYLGKDGSNQTLGLMAERVTETVQQQEKACADPGIRIENAPYLGKVAMREDGEEMIQYIQVERLLSEALSDVLFVDQGDMESRSD
jgi:chemotaxis-related protein WspB